MSDNTRRYSSRPELDDEVEILEYLRRLPEDEDWPDLAALRRESVLGDDATVEDYERVLQRLRTR